MSRNTANEEPLGRIYPFNYFVARKEQREFKIHQRRDLGAAIELLHALYQHGYAYGEPILNFPPDEPPAEPHDGDDVFSEPDLASALLEMDLSFFAPGDLILQTTRPPLDDQGHGTKKRVERGYTQLEGRLLELWRNYLGICARSHVRIATDLRKELQSGYESRRDMQFRQQTLAPFSSLSTLAGKRTTPPPHRTAAFLLRVEEAWKNGPGFLGAFAMDGTTTQVWCYRLAHDFPELLREPGFVVAEIETVPPAPVKLVVSISVLLRATLSSASTTTPPAGAPKNDSLRVSNDTTSVNRSFPA